MHKRNDKKRENQFGTKSFLEMASKHNRNRINNNKHQHNDKRRFFTDKAHQPHSKFALFSRTEVKIQYMERKHYEKFKKPSVVQKKNQSYFPSF